MGKVARQVVEQAGVDVNVLLDKPIRAAGAEFTTFYYYTILAWNWARITLRPSKGMDSPAARRRDVGLDLSKLQALKPRDERLVSRAVFCT
jgi:hypothetical protein